MKLMSAQTKLIQEVMSPSILCWIQLVLVMSKDLEKNLLEG